MPTLAAPLSPADSEDGGSGLLEGATVAGVKIVATDDVRLVVATEGCAEVVDWRDVVKRSPLVEEADWSCVSVYVLSIAFLHALTPTDGRGNSEDVGRADPGPASTND